MRLPWFSKLKYLVTGNSALRELTVNAERGDAVAQNLLGSIYATDNSAEAIHWYRKAADQGNATAQCSLAMMYAMGKGVPQDHERAYIWLLLGIPHLMGEAQDSGSKLRDEIAAMLTQQQIEDAKRIAHEWKPVQSK